MITQTEADNLISPEKKKPTDEQYNFPDIGDCLTIPIISIDGSENFLIDVNRKGKIKLSKCT
ncbi:MAG: hypothetical protein R6V04_00505 [bacterium]